MNGDLSSKPGPGEDPSAQILSSNRQFMEAAQGFARQSEKYKERKRDFDLKFVYIDAGSISIFLTLIGVLYQSGQGAPDLRLLFLFCLLASVILWFASMVLLLWSSGLLVYKHEYEASHDNLVELANKTLYPNRHINKKLDKGAKTLELADGARSWGYRLFAIAYLPALVFLVGLVLSSTSSDDVNLQPASSSNTAVSKVVYMGIEKAK